MIDTQSMPTLADITRHQAKLRPEDEAIWFEGHKTTYKQLDQRASQVANGLIKAGVKPGHRVSYLGKNMDVYYEILFGASKARASLASMNNRLAAPELQFAVSYTHLTLPTTSRV